MKKKLLSVCFALVLMIGLLPSQAFAVDADDPQLESFLETIDWELEDYEDYLADFGLELDDFDDAAYLGTPLSEEGLEEIYNTYDLTYDELNDLLYEEEGLLEEDEEFPDSIWYMFIEDIEFSLDLIMNDPLTALDEDLSEENLEAVAAEYNFGSIEELEELFNLYEDSINNYTTLFEIENATEIYVSMEDGSGLDDEMREEDDDASEVDDLWEDNSDLSLDLLDSSILSDEPIFDIYAMLTVMLLEAALDFK